jgi:hypothetical protein
VRRAAFVLSVALVASALPASADEAGSRARTSSLSWVRMPGAEGCIATQALARAVEERLGREVFVSAAQADVSVEGRVAPKKAGGWHAVVTVRDAMGALLGTREVDRPEVSCDAMTSPLALVVAIMIDPDAALGPKPPPPKKEEPPPPTVIVKREQVLVPVPVPVPVPEDPAPFRFEGSAAITGALGFLPGPAVGLAALGLLEPRKAIPFIGSGGYWFDNAAKAAGTAANSFSVFLLGGGFCPLWHHGQGAHLYACALGHLGLLRSHPSGFAASNGDENHVVWNGGIDLRATVLVVRPFVVRAGVQGMIPLLRDKFTFTRADGSEAELFRMAPVIGMVDLGIGLALP